MKLELFVKGISILTIQGIIGKSRSYFWLLQAFTIAVMLQKSVKKVCVCVGGV